MGGIITGQTIRLGDLSRQEFEHRLAKDGLTVEFGPFIVNMRVNVSTIWSVAFSLYRDYPLAAPGAMIDFHVRMEHRRGPRHWLKPQTLFFLDGRPPFVPSAINHCFPSLEWGINWCIATRAHHFLMLHSAVVERNGQAILLPAWPGHGKSTLCAALIHSGWRLLSDEFGLVRPEDGMLLPIPRLIPLKNQSIDVIRQFSPGAILGPAFIGTRKGTVAHVRPPADSILRAQEPARPRWLIFPRWIADAPLSLEPVSKSQAFLMVATNAFNYEVLDQTAFRIVTDMVEACDCHALVYSDLTEAIAAIDTLTDTNHG